MSKRKSTNSLQRTVVNFGDLTFIAITTTVNVELAFELDTARFKSLYTTFDFEGHIPVYVPVQIGQDRITWCAQNQDGRVRGALIYGTGTTIRAALTTRAFI